MDHLTKIERKLQTRIIVGGDANAKSIWWGSTETDARGEEFCGLLQDMRMHVLNKGKVPTFDTIRGGRRLTSFVDVTACTTDLLDLVEDWRVDPGLTSSDHSGILFSLSLKKSKGIKIQRSTRIYNTKKANWEIFRTKLKQQISANKITINDIKTLNNTLDLELKINYYQKSVTDACDKAIPKTKAKEAISMPWWSEKLGNMKKLVATKKRRIPNAAPVRREKVVRDYLDEKEKYEQEASRAAITSWKEFCAKQDKEGLWEGIYRVIGRTSRRDEDLPLIKDGRTLDAEGSAKFLAETFYPEDLNDNDSDLHAQIRIQANAGNDDEQDETCDPPFTFIELETATQSFNPKKAPGKDGFTADICQHSIAASPETFLELLNKCTELNYFPIAWKQAVVVILRKPGKDDYSVPKSHRPIALLPILGKIYEKMIVSRLKHYLLPKFSKSQYGFMPQRSTEDSLYDLTQHIRKQLEQKKIVTLVSLDIEGAFDNAWWPAIKMRLKEEGCPTNLRKVISSYLQDRVVNVRYLDKEYSKATSKGCVQGSIGGPILWNLLLDPLLRELEKAGDYCQAFADDVVLAFDGATALEIEGRASAALARVQAWGDKNKLKFAPHKTNSVNITRKLKYDTPRLSMGGIDIAASREIKLLGVTIDDKLTYNTHVSNVCKKAIGVHKQLSRAAKASWGLHPEIIKIIYRATVEPIVLYAASVWAPAAYKIGTRNKLASLQRGIAQTITKAYRTVSLNSALILAGILPLDLRVREAAALYYAKRGIPRPELKDRVIERPTCALLAPHPAERVKINFDKLEDSIQVQTNSNFDVRIFTDGSGIEGKIGAALSWWNSATEIKAQKFALSSSCTVYQAELYAICRASKEILKSKASSFGIYSDSMAALQTIANPGSLHSLAIQTRENLKILSLQNKTARLFWIKAHAGLEGNERADQLAKEAALGSRVRPVYDLCPVSFVKRSIRMATLDEWNNRYINGDTASVTKIFLPNVRTAHYLTNKFTIDNALTQAMTGHGGFSEYLHRFKCKESPACICDPAQEESIMHLLTECPVNGRRRYDLEQEIDREINIDTIKEIMIGKNRNMFLDYCRTTVKDVTRRNK